MDGGPAKRLGPVQLFHTCIVNEIYPKVAYSVIKILRNLGCEVDVPLEQTCCGQPAFNSGYQEDARRIARYTIDVLASTDGPVVIPSGSCADMILHGYRELLAEESEYKDKLDGLAPRCFEFTQFLVDELGVTDLGAQLSQKIAYHPGCHLLRGLRIDRQPRLLLKGISGVELVEFEDQRECCGFGGLFSIDNPRISANMLENKIAHLRKAAVDIVTSCDMGCLLHLEGGLHRSGSAIQVRHLAQVLAHGMGL